MDPKYSSIGNILDQSIEDIWKGEKAEYLRNLLREECFMHCRPQGCPRIQNNDFPEIYDTAEFERLTRTADRPKHINLAYDFVCNQYCETCRKTVFVPPGDYKEKCEIIRQKITPCIDSAGELSASGHGDPFANPQMMDLLAGLHPSNKRMKYCWKQTAYISMKPTGKE
jgi:MoaA/NifB/PqqE/SkfB family radical SAM enzyme